MQRGNAIKREKIQCCCRLFFYLLISSESYKENITSNVTKGGRCTPTKLWTNAHRKEGSGIENSRFANFSDMNSPSLFQSGIAGHTMVILTR